jgi:hypothetical protein
LFSYPTLYANAIGTPLDVFKAPLSEKFILVSGCSATGAPTYVLKDMISEGNLLEASASENHRETRTGLAQKT